MLLHAGRNTPLTRLCDTLDAIFEACAHFPEPSNSTFFARSMRIALADAAANPDLLTATQREGRLQKYRRHLLAADPHGRYAIAALVWLAATGEPRARASHVVRLRGGGWHAERNGIRMERRAALCERHAHASAQGGRGVVRARRPWRDSSVG